MTALARVHVVTDDAVLNREGFLDRAEGVLHEGGPAVALHLRGPNTSGRVLYEMVSALVVCAREAGAGLIVNDRLDLALMLAPSGVHLGRRSLSPPSCRALLGDSLLIGASVHGVEGLESNRLYGADYAFAGSVFRTDSHPGREGFGLPGLTAVVAAAGPLPVIGIGGVEPVDVEGVLSTGAYGVAMIGGVWGRVDPSAATREYLEALDSTPEPKEVPFIGGEKNAS